MRAPQFILGALLIAAAALYRPVVMWADNAWDMSDPERLIGAGFIAFAAALIPYIVTTRLGIRPMAAAIGLAGGLHVVFNWHHLSPHPLLWIAVLGALTVVAHFKMTPQVAMSVAYVGLAVLLVAPLTQLVVEHVRQRIPYPVIDRTQNTSATTSGVVEDVVIVVTDSYPSLAVAEAWFGHETSALEARLTEMGFTVEPIAWSQHTFTGLAIPAMLELGPVVEPGPKGSWGNRLSVYEMVRGENLTANALREAGFHYTHIESSWDGGSCGSVDSCVESTWPDEIMWELLRPSIFSDLMTERYGYHTVSSSLNVVDYLTSMADRFHDGRHDYVFAHLLLPHVPLVVDETCSPSMEDSGAGGQFAPGYEGVIDARKLRSQLACVDRLLTQIAEVAGEGTGIVITGDHGMATGGQLQTPGEEWSDGEIAERLGVFLAYRLPTGCTPPSTNVNTDVVRALIECAIDMDTPPHREDFMIGADEPVRVSPSRVHEIERALRTGTLLPPEQMATSEP